MNMNNMYARNILLKLPCRISQGNSTEKEGVEDSRSGEGQIQF